MMKRLGVELWATAILLATAAAPAVSRPVADPQGEPADLKNGEKTKMSAEQEAMMAAWQKAMTPGERHRALDPLVGTFEARNRIWLAPNAPVQESKGISENRLVLGGRYLEQRYSGTSMGMPFEGIGYTGYDNIRQTYVGAWMDNFGTGIVTSLGTGTPSPSEIQTRGEMLDPLTGKSSPTRSVIRVVDSSRHIFTMYGTGPDGREYRMMEIEYTRK